MMVCSLPRRTRSCCLVWAVLTRRPGRQHLAAAIEGRWKRTALSEWLLQTAAIIEPSRIVDLVRDLPGFGKPVKVLKASDVAAPPKAAGIKAMPRVPRHAPPKAPSTPDLEARPVPCSARLDATMGATLDAADHFELQALHRCQQLAASEGVRPRNACAMIFNTAHARCGSLTLR